MSFMNVHWKISFCEHLFNYSKWLSIKYSLFAKYYYYLCFTSMLFLFYLCNYVENMSDLLKYKKIKNIVRYKRYVWNVVINSKIGLSVSKAWWKVKYKLKNLKTLKSQAQKLMNFEGFSMTEVEESLRLSTDFSKEFNHEFNFLIKWKNTLFNDKI